MKSSVKILAPFIVTPFALTLLLENPFRPKDVPSLGILFLIEFSFLVLLISISIFRKIRLEMIVIGSFFYFLAMIGAFIFSFFLVWLGIGFLGGTP